MANPRKLTWPERFWDRVNLSEDGGGCWIWLGSRDRKGYGVCSTPTKHYDRAHRISWELTNHQVVPSGKLVCHSCDNPVCVNPSHLFIGSARDNVVDAYRKGRSQPPPRGEKSAWRRGRAPNSKHLTLAQVADIRTAVSNGTSIVNVARQLGRSPSTIKAIINGRSWVHV